MGMMKKIILPILLGTCGTYAMEPQAPARSVSPKGPVSRVKQGLPERLGHDLIIIWDDDASLSDIRKDIDLMETDFLGALDQGVAPILTTIQVLDGFFAWNSRKENNFALLCKDKDLVREHAVEYEKLKQAASLVGLSRGFEDAYNKKFNICKPKAFERDLTEYLFALYRIDWRQWKIYRHRENPDIFLLVSLNYLDQQKQRVTREPQPSDLEIMGFSNSFNEINSEHFETMFLEIKTLDEAVAKLVSVKESLEQVRTLERWEDVNNEFKKTNAFIEQYLKQFLATYSGPKTAAGVLYRWIYSLHVRALDGIKKERIEEDLSRNRFMREGLEDFFRAGLSREFLKTLRRLIDIWDEVYARAEKFFESKNQAVTESIASSLQSCFQKNDLLPWYIFWIGHGDFDKSIAGIPDVEFTSLLRFFNTHIKTAFVFYDTCFGGGYHTLKTYYDGIKQNMIALNFPIGVGATTDATSTGILLVPCLEKEKINTPGYCGFANNFKDFFDLLHGRMSLSPNQEPWQEILGKVKKCGRAP